MSTEDQSRKTKKGRTEERRRKESGSLLVWVLRTGRSSMVEPARAYNYPATIAQSFFAPHKPHHHNKVASRRWGIDLKEAYLQVPVHPASRHFFRFMFRGTVYQFKALRFGLSTAPQVFTRVMAPVSAILDSLGIRMR